MVFRLRFYEALSYSVPCVFDQTIYFMRELLSV